MEVARRLVEHAGHRIGDRLVNRLRRLFELVQQILRAVRGLLDAALKLAEDAGRRGDRLPGGLIERPQRLLAGVVRFFPVAGVLVRVLLRLRRVLVKRLDVLMQRLRELLRELRAQLVELLNRLLERAGTLSRFRRGLRCRLSVVSEEVVEAANRLRQRMVMLIDLLHRLLELLAVFRGARRTHDFNGPPSISTGYSIALTTSRTGLIASTIFEISWTVFISSFTTSPN